MQCPNCRTSWICVIESRHTNEDAISRRRKCKACDHVWATAEVIVPDDAIVWRNKRRTSTVTKAQFQVKASVLEALQHKVSEQANAASSSPIRPTA